MNATKAARSRYAIYAAPPARRSSVNLIPHTIAFAAAFSFVTALIIGAI
ncbi:hypothetical protein [Sinorhizobium chiapasense]|uniref:Uncharacterized protein n=1 Tax=Sinorhizobium chiapasense TaxID=501572 RepID=A0ABZ2B996_9HYPH